MDDEANQQNPANYLDDGAGDPWHRRLEQQWPGGKGHLLWLASRGQERKKLAGKALERAYLRYYLFREPVNKN